MMSEGMKDIRDLDCCYGAAGSEEEVVFSIRGERGGCEWRRVTRDFFETRISFGTDHLEHFEAFRRL